MTHYLIESTVCMAVLYGFYHVLLRPLKIFRFNRHYLLLSVVFSLMIPLVTIPTSLPILTVFPWNTVEQTTEAAMNPSQGGYHISETEALSPATHPSGDITPTEPVTSEMRKASGTGRINTLSILVILYGLVSATLLIRFLVNIRLMIRQIRTSPRATGHPGVVLVKQSVLPFSFAGYIFVNQQEYENGSIDRRLIAHEQAHCAGHHTADILLIEILILFLWFNPFLWLFQRAIRLNHEFLADHSVLSVYDLNGYKETLFQLVCRNNSGNLASNFNISLTKTRLIMMTRSNFPQNAWLRKWATAPLFMLLTVTLTFSQKASSADIFVTQTEPVKSASSAPVVLKDKAPATTSTPATKVALFVGEPASTPTQAPKAAPSIMEDKGTSSVYSMPFPQAIGDPNGASQELLNEYHALLEKFMVRADAPGNQGKTGGINMALNISNKDGNKVSYIFNPEILTLSELGRLEFIFGKMSQTQKKRYVIISIPTKGMVIKLKEPSPELLENLKKRGDVNLYIDEKKVGPEVLNNYKSTDFSSAFQVLHRPENERLYMSLAPDIIGSSNSSDSLSIHLQTNEYYRAHRPAIQKESYSFGVPALVNAPSVKEVSVK